MSLHARTLRGVGWSMLATWGDQTVTLLVLFVMARLLEPADFGLVAIAAAFVMLMQLVVRFTFNQALVQRQELTDAHLDSAFWLALAMAVLAVAILSAGAGLVAEIFAEPELSAMLPALSMIALLSAVSVVQESRLMRNLAFRPIAAASITGVAGGGAMGITLALLDYGPWSIIAQALTQSALRAVVVWLVSPWRPRLAFSRRRAAEIMSFGKHVSGNAVVGFVADRGDTLIIGYFLDPGSLGLFNVGRRLMRIIANLGCGALVRVLLSSYARMQEDPERLKRGILEALKLSALALMPALAGLAVVSEEAVLVLLGGKWQAAAPVVALLAIGSLTQIIGYLNLTGVVAMGKPHWQFASTTGFAVTNVIAVLVAVQWGIVAVAGALAVTTLAYDQVTILMIRRLVPIRHADYVRAMAPAAIGAAVMAACVQGLRLALDGALGPLPALALYVAVGAAIYVVMMSLLAPALVRQAFGLVRDLVRRDRQALADVSS